MTITTLAPEMYQALNGEAASPMVYHALILFERLSCRMADRVIATNESYKKLQMERSGIPEQRIVVVRNGPNLSRLKPSAPDPEIRR